MGSGQKREEGASRVSTKKDMRFLYTQESEYNWSSSGSFSSFRHHSQVRGKCWGQKVQQCVQLRPGPSVKIGRGAQPICP